MCSLRYHFTRYCLYPKLPDFGDNAAAGFPQRLLCRLSWTLVTQHLGVIAFIVVAVGAINEMSLELPAGHPLHLLFGVVAVLMMLVNAHQAGFLPFFGKHPRVSGHCKNVRIVFTPFWIVVALLNWMAFG